MQELTGSAIEAAEQIFPAYLVNYVGFKAADLRSLESARQPLEIVGNKEKKKNQPLPRDANLISRHWDPGNLNAAPTGK